MVHRPSDDPRGAHDARFRGDLKRRRKRPTGKRGDFTLGRRKQPTQGKAGPGDDLFPKKLPGRRKRPTGPTGPNVRTPTKGRLRVGQPVGKVPPKGISHPIGRIKPPPIGRFEPPIIRDGPPRPKPVSGRPGGPKNLRPPFTFKKPTNKTTNRRRRRT